MALLVYDKCLVGFAPKLNLISCFQMDAGLDKRGVLSTFKAGTQVRIRVVQSCNFKHLP